MVGCTHSENFKLVTFDLPKLHWIEMFKIAYLPHLFNSLPCQFKPVIIHVATKTKTNFDKHKIVTILKQN